MENVVTYWTWVAFNYITNTRYQLIRKLHVYSSRNTLRTSNKDKTISMQMYCNKPSDMCLAQKIITHNQTMQFYVNTIK